MYMPACIHTSIYIYADMHKIHIYIYTYTHPFMKHT